MSTYHAQLKGTLNVKHPFLVENATSNHRTKHGMVGVWSFQLKPIECTQSVTASDLLCKHDDYSCNWSRENSEHSQNMQIIAGTISSWNRFHKTVETKTMFCRFDPCSCVVAGDVFRCRILEYKLLKRWAKWCSTWYQHFKRRSDKTKLREEARRKVVCTQSRVRVLQLGRHFIDRRVQLSNLVVQRASRRLQRTTPK